MSKRKPKMGRPKLGPGLKRTASVLLKLRPEEREAYDRAARREGLPLAVWARKALDSAAGR